MPGSSPRGTPDPLSGCAGTVPVGFVARLLIEGSGRFFILADCISGVEWPRFFKKRRECFTLCCRRPFLLLGNVAPNESKRFW